MAAIAVYNMKGGVGKTSLAVNLAWSSAVESEKRTLLVDLDGQAASSFILGGSTIPPCPAVDVLKGDVPPERAIVSTRFPGLDLLPADVSLRALDMTFATLGKVGGLADVIAALGAAYDTVILDCPPGIGPTTREVVRASSMILVPMIPSLLSSRACDEVCEFVGDDDDAPPIFPIFTMVDRRRKTHQASLAADPTFPSIPAASLVEEMAERHAPIGAYAPRSPAARQFSSLWQLIISQLA